VAGVAVVAGVAGPAKVLATLFSDSYRDSYDPTKGSGCRSEPVLSPHNHSSSQGGDKVVSKSSFLELVAGVAHVSGRVRSKSQKTKDLSQNVRKCWEMVSFVF